VYVMLSGFPLQGVYDLNLRDILGHELKLDHYVQM
jgi:hypothetical protein